MRALVGFAVLFSLLVSACAGEASSVPMGVDEYVTVLDQVVVEFEASMAESSKRDYPIEGELVNATGVFEAYGGELAVLRTIAPPPSLADSHGELVAAFETMQAEVSDYLVEAGMEGGFTFAHLNEDPRVAEAVNAFFDACERLVDNLSLVGADHIPPVCPGLDG